VSDKKNQEDRPENQRHDSDRTSHTGRLITLAVGALGVVFGDIGTSPLYALKECFRGFHPIAVNHINIMGVISLIFWSLTMVVSVKYVSFILHADNHGEGGIFALLGLTSSNKDSRFPKFNATIVIVAITGAALLYGDGVITPAISVLSAIEGLGVATSAADPYIVPLTCIILFGLFMVQRRGTARIGSIFGPVMFIWFTVITILGLLNIFKAPVILAAVNPMHAIRFFADHHFHGIIVMGSVVLCITGGEALYADLGHFGRRPIRLSWYLIVYPALIINYMGQGALLFANEAVAENPFYGMVPRQFLYPMVCLATMATIIASQALISGIFSLTQQAVQFGFCPRLRITHTSSEKEGQIYISGVNNALMIACIGVVIMFKESAGLAGAYGIAVTLTMVITTLMYYMVLTGTYKWPKVKALPLIAVFLLIDMGFVIGNLFKIRDGGWVTLMIAAIVIIFMTTWKDGREKLSEKLLSMRFPLEMFLKDVAAHPITRVRGTAVFMTVSPVGTPPALLHHVKHNQVLHDMVILLSIRTSDIPQVERKDRIALTDLGQGFYQVIANYGFMEYPNIPEIMRLLGRKGIDTDPAKTTYYLGRETLLTGGDSKMMKWRKALFAFMSRNASNPTIFFGIPPNRVIELGTQIEM
jgi:KUP system potassium uptake protein